MIATMTVIARPFVKLAVAVGAVLILLLLWTFHSESYTVAIPRRAGQESHPWPASDIFNSTLGFEKIFVVGLPSRTDRRDGMTLQASLSNIEIEFIDGVLGKDVSDKAIPTDGEHERLGDASIGSWRAHLNAVREIVSRNLSSALIFEDDVDWDIRIRDQLQDFALSSRALIQPLAGQSGSYADPTYPEAPADTETGPTEFKLDYLRPTTNPAVSPYGDGWDVLWLGHCGMHFPFAKNAIPKGRIVHENDDTVAEKKHLWTFNKPFTLKEDYAEHTRVVHHSQEGVCSLGYAVSQRGARRLLHEVALKDMSDAYDILLRFFCEGTHGRKRATCLTTQPALFHHHRPVGPNSAASDIGNHGEGFHATASTDMVRWSVRLNAEALLDGRTDYVDQFGKTE